MRVIRRVVAIGFLSTGLVSGSLALSSAPASAVVGHTLLSQITEGKGATALSALGLNFDSGGNLFVIGNGNVNEFNSANVPIGQIVGAGGEDVAVDNTTGDVYTTNSGGSTVYVYRPEGGGYKFLQERRFSNFNGNYVYVAANNLSVGPYAGDVYVNSAQHEILVLKPNAEGKLEEPIGQLPQPEEGFSLLGPNTSGDITTNRATGEVYVANPGTLHYFSGLPAQPGYIDEYNASGAYIGHIGLGKSAGEFEPTYVAVDETTGDVYAVDAAHGLVDQFNAAGKFLGVVAQETPPGLWGVAVNASGDVYISTGGPVDVFGPTVSLPAVSTGASNEVLRVTAKVEGTLNPEGEEVVSCKFEYGTSLAYGQTAECGPPAPYSGSGVVKVSAKLSGLTLGATYHFRLAASNANGTNRGVDHTFKTLEVVPGLQTTEATKIEFTNGEHPELGTVRATLNGSFEPDGADTHYYFEYGETTAYGSVSPELPGTDAGEAFKSVSAQTEVGGLKFGKTYHFRLVATNSYGTVKGGDQSFVTPGLAPVVQTNSSEVVLSGTRIVGTLLGTVEPRGKETYYYFEYGETETYGSASPKLPGTFLGEGVKVVPVKTQLIGLTPFTLYHYRLTATNAYGTSHGADMSFETGALIPVPSIGVLPPSFVSQFTATLNATLETGQALVGYHFEYGTTTAYGSVAPIPDHYTPITGETVTVSQPIYELQAGTTYHYRLVANSPGGDATGPDETFTTLSVPASVVSTGGASNVGVGSATVGGAIDPLGWETSYLIEYGTTAAYGSSWPTVPVPMGALEGVQPVVVSLLNLLPKTTYHYRLVATSGGGTVYGSDQAFTTGEYAPQLIQEPVTIRTLEVPSGELLYPSSSTKKAKKAKKKSKKSKGHHSAKHGKKKGKRKK